MKLVYLDLEELDHQQGLPLFHRQQFVQWLPKYVALDHVLPQNNFAYNSPICSRVNTDRRVA